MRKTIAIRLLCLCMFGGPSFFPQESAIAQDVPPETTNPEPQTQTAKDDEKHRGSIIIAPLPIVSPAIGSGIVPVAGYIFPFQEKDKSSPPSVVGMAGVITNNGSRGVALLADLFMKENRYELSSFYVYGKLDYDLSGGGFENGDADLKLPLEQKGQGFSVKLLRNLGWNIFAGGRFMTGNSMITVKPASGAAPPIPPDVGLTTNLRALGMEVVRDSRPNRFYPTGGTFVDFTADFFAQNLGSKYSFQSYNFTFNKYWSPGKTQVVAYNLYGCGTGGEPPFYGECIYGTKSELRGYTAGRYLDRYMFATQLEYRLELPWRLGLVGFGGLGGVAPGADKFKSKQFLPAGGTGIRLLMSRKFHVNLRTDFAWGKDNFTWSMGMGEAF